MHPFSGSALFSLKKIAGSFTFIVLFHVCGLCVRISVELIVKCLFVLWLQVRIQRGGTGGPDPPGKSLSTGNKQLDPPPPPGKCWTPSGTLKMIVFFGINHLTSVK